MASKAPSQNTKKTYEPLHRYFAGLTLLCFLVSVVGMTTLGGMSLFSDGSYLTIDLMWIGFVPVPVLTTFGAARVAWRACIILAILAVIQRIVIRSWAMWDGLRNEHPERKKHK